MLNELVKESSDRIKLAICENYSLVQDLNYLLSYIEGIEEICKSRQEKEIKLQKEAIQKDVVIEDLLSYFQNRLSKKNKDDLRIFYLLNSGNKVEVEKGQSFLSEKSNQLRDKKHKKFVSSIFSK